MDQDGGSIASDIKLLRELHACLLFDLLQAGAATGPSEGVEFSSHELARAYALGIVSTFQSGDKSYKQDRVSIRDETGMQIGEVSSMDLMEEPNANLDPPDAERDHRKPER